MAAAALKHKRDFAPVEGARLSKDEARVVGVVMEALQRRDGFVTPTTFVQEAKKPASPIHPLFEWDVQKAAETHWLERAQYLMRSVQVTWIGPDRKERLYRLVTNIKNDPDSQEGVYLTTGKAVSVEEYRKQILEVALRELDGWRRRYSMLSELDAVFETIDGLLGKK